MSSEKPRSDRQPGKLDSVPELEPDWEKVGNLLPTIVQDAATGRVLMLGYMSPEALAQTLLTGRVTFFSRSRGELWTKGETSGNGLELLDLRLDCDRDALLVRATPSGPTCHRGTTTCFDGSESLEELEPTRGVGLFLEELDAIVADRARERAAGSYTASLLGAGPSRAAQKVGEEAVEVALAGVASDASDLVEEAADLLYHLLVLLRTRDLALADVDRRLAERHGGASVSNRDRRHTDG